ncbi:hypothetical protein [Rhodococcus sp. NPDC058521]
MLEQNPGSATMPICTVHPFRYRLLPIHFGYPDAYPHRRTEEE